MSEKESIRSSLLQRRSVEPWHSIQEKSNHIKQHLFNLEAYEKAQTVFYYVSYDHEVITHEMIKESLSTTKTILVPITHKYTHSITPSQLHSWEELIPQAYGILVPEREQSLPVTLIDVIIIPGVGFDRIGNRIGHGKGYYDLLLTKARHALFIGLAFEFQIIDYIPTEDHDMPMDLIITEKHILRCSNRKH